MKQIGIGIMQYVQDYDEQLPKVVRSLAGSEGSTNKITSEITSWHDVVQPYVKSYQVMRCPSASNSNVPLGTSIPADDQDVRTPYVGASDDNVTYAFSGFSHTPAKLSEFNSTADTLLVGEALDTSTRTFGYGMGPSGTAFGNLGNTAGNLHLEGANYLWVDGHVKWLRPDKPSQTIGGVVNYYWLKVKP